MLLSLFVDFDFIFIEHINHSGEIPVCSGQRLQGQIFEGMQASFLLVFGFEICTISTIQVISPAASKVGGSKVISSKVYKHFLSFAFVFLC